MNEDERKKKDRKEYSEVTQPNGNINWITFVIQTFPH